MDCDWYSTVCRKQIRDAYINVGRVGPPLSM